MVKEPNLNINNVKIHFKVLNWSEWPLKNKLVKKTKRANINSFCIETKKSNFVDELRSKKDGCVYQIKKLSGSLFYKIKNEELTVNITGIPNFELILPCVKRVCSQIKIPYPMKHDIKIDTSTASVRLNRRIGINGLIHQLKTVKCCPSIKLVPKTNYTFSGQTIKWQRISIIVFNSGSIVFLGARSVNDLMTDATHFLTFLQDYLNNQRNK